MTDYVIRANTEEAAYWNVNAGWVAQLREATIFTGRERRMMEPPKGGRWVTLSGTRV